MITIKQHDKGTHGFFEALDETRKAGHMTYTWHSPFLISIDHTEVDPEWKGQGIGKQLVLAGIEMARKSGLKIIPLCPYAKALMEKDEDLQDVLFRG